MRVRAFVGPARGAGGGGCGRGQPGTSLGFAGAAPFAIQFLVLLSTVIKLSGFLHNNVSKSETALSYVVLFFKYWKNVSVPSIDAKITTAGDRLRVTHSFAAARLKA